MWREYPSPPEGEMPVCPVCGQECETYYKNLNGEVLGCDECIEAVDAREHQQEQRDICRCEEWRRYHDENYDEQRGFEDEQDY